MEKIEPSGLYIISDQYFTDGGKPYVIQNQAIKKQIRTKAMRYLSLVKRGILKSQLNILKTKENLLKK